VPRWFWRRGGEAEEGGHAVVGTAEGKRRKQPVASPEAEEALSEQLGGENDAVMKDSKWSVRMLRRPE